MANTIDILDLLFDKILRIDVSGVCNIRTISCATLQEQLLNLFLIPHIILFLFIYGLSWILVPMHKGLRYLVSIGAYLTIVIMGSPYSYYSTLITLFLLWWQLALVIGIFFFIWSRIIHPSKVPELFRIGKSAMEKVTEKSKRNTAIEKKIDSIEAQIRALENRQHRAIQESGRPNPVIEAEIAELDRRRAELEKEL